MRQNVIVFMFVLVGLCGCIGTVNDANTPSTYVKDSSNKNYPLDYEGISSAIPIANDKVEISFPPVGKDMEKIIFAIRYNGLQGPVYVSAKGLKPDYRGRLNYTLTKLQSDTNYYFSVQAFNVETGIESQSPAAKLAKTFSNNTANFYGISELRHLQGAAGAKGIEVFWNPAEVKGTIVTKDEIDPIEYKITVIDGSEINPGSMDDISYSDSVRKVISVSADKRSVVINGLRPAKKYFVQARAVHYGVVDNPSNSNYKTEKNSKYLEISTYSDEVSDIIFDPTSYKLNLPSGNFGLYSINAEWGTTTGNFDHYRLYYAVQGEADLNDYLNTEDGDVACSGHETANASVYCVPVESTKISKLLTGLKVNSTYDIAIAVCASAACARDKRIIGGLLSKKTTPPVASFQGINKINVARSIEEIDRIYLNFSLPNFLSGGISGYLVRYYGDDTTNSSPVDINDPLVPNETGLFVHPYNVMTDTEIAISGINPLSQKNYCFMMVPFSYNNDGTRNYGDVSNSQPKCILPTLKGPSKDEFAGIDSINCDPSGFSLEISWSPPTRGIYSNYELFYKKGSAPFTFGQAINWEQYGYQRIMLNPNINSYTFFGLAPASVHWVGVLTYYDSPLGLVRSEFNAKYFNCSL